MIKTSDDFIRQGNFFEGSFLFMGIVWFFGSKTGAPVPGVEKSVYIARSFQARNNTFS